MTPSTQDARATGLVGRIMCGLGFHPCTTNSDDNGVWGECIRCHRKFGYVSRYALRQYIEAEAQARALAASTKDQNDDG